MSRPAGRRILSIWFPRLGAERLTRRARLEAPFALVAEEGQARLLSSLDAAAEEAGLARGMALADARAICPGLLTRPADPPGEAAFLAALRRWAGRFSPFVAEDGAESLLLDVSGVAHLFGGEAGLAAAIAEGTAGLGLSARLGLADTPGAAWALARFGGIAPAPLRRGDAIDQEAPATRARAAKRRPGAAPGRPADPPTASPSIAAPLIAPPGRTLAALSALPVAALRLPEDSVAGLARLGLRQIADLVGMPRGALARRFGVGTIRRLDQALGAEPEPISPARTPPAFALRLTLPEPIGLMGDIEAGFERLLGPLCVRLEAAGMGARRLRLDLRRVDGTVQRLEIGLARPGRDPARIRPVMALRLAEAEAGFGIDMLRLSAPLVEPSTPRQHKGGLAAEAEVRARMEAGGGDGFAALLGRLGARVGLEALIRLQPADSHIPEKTARRAAAAFTEPSSGWPAPPAPRPMVLLPPEPVEAGPGRPPRAIRWRRRRLDLAFAEGPERIAPEWWLDDPAWRTGLRDYWRVEAADGTRLWLFEARGAERSGGWFVHGIFA